MLIPDEKLSALKLVMPRLNEGGHMPPDVLARVLQVQNEKYEKEYCQPQEIPPEKCLHYEWTGTCWQCTDETVNEVVIAKLRALQRKLRKILESRQEDAIRIRSTIKKVIATLEQSDPEEKMVLYQILRRQRFLLYKQLWFRTWRSSWFKAMWSRIAQDLIGNDHTIDIDEVALVDAVIEVEEEEVNYKPVDELDVVLDIVTTQRSVLHYDGIPVPEMIGVSGARTIRIKNQNGNLPKFLPIALDLEELEVSYCENLTTLPTGFDQLTSLTDLSVLGCRKLTSLPKHFGNLKALTALDLGGSALTSLPDSIGDLTNLKELYMIECTSLVSLPDSFGGCKALETLYLNGCTSLISLPDSIGECESLTELNLFYCENLTSLPRRIGELKSLKELSLPSHMEEND